MANMEAPRTFERLADPFTGSAFWELPAVSLREGNVNPGLTNPWLINRGVSPFNGDSSFLEGTPPTSGTG